MLTRTMQISQDEEREQSRYVSLSDMQDPETAPDPEFASMRFEEIDQVLYEIDYDERLSYEEWEYANRSWFFDHRISHG